MWLKWSHAVSFCRWMPVKAQLAVDPPETEDHSIVKTKVTFVKVLFNCASLHLPSGSFWCQLSIRVSTMCAPSLSGGVEFLSKHRIIPEGWSWTMSKLKMHPSAMGCPSTGQLCNTAGLHITKGLVCSLQKHGDKFLDKSARTFSPWILPVGLKMYRNQLFI